MANSSPTPSVSTVTPADPPSSNPSVVTATLESQRAVTLDEDSLLIERFVAGDADSFTRLYRKYYDKVFSIARGVLLDAEEAADAVQEVFTLVHRHLPRFDRRARFSTWLFRIAVNRSIQEGRKRKHRSRNVPLTEAADREAPLPKFESDPRIQEVLAKLRAEDRALLLLFYWEELSLQEIADTVGCNVNAAKTRLYRAREKFRAFYEEDA